MTATARPLGTRRGGTVTDKVWAVVYDHGPTRTVARCLGCGQTREVGRIELWRHGCEVDQQGELM